MKETMETLKQELQQKLCINHMGLNFRIEDVIEYDIKTINFYLAGNKLPFVKMMLVNNILTATDTLCIYYLPKNYNDNYALLGRIISPQIEILQQKNAYKVLKRHFEDNDEKTEIKEMTIEQIVEMILQDMKERLK